MVIVKRLISAGIALGVGLAVAIGGVVTPAAAATLATPVANLPSMVQTGTGYTDAGKQGNALVAAMAYLYKNALSPEAYEAYKARQAGTIPSAPQVSAEDYQKGQFTSPTTPAAGLTKVVNGASTVFGGYTIGTALGSFAGQPIFNAVGIDANGAVCGASTSGGVVQKLLELGTGQDCAAFNAAEGYVPNQDAVVNDFKIKACEPDSGRCIELAATSTRKVSSGGSAWASGDSSYQIPLRCFTYTGGSGRSGFYALRESGTVQNLTTADGGNWWNADFGDNSPSCGGADGTGAVGWPNGAGKLDEIVGIRFGTKDVWQRPAQSSGDPDRYISCDVTGSKGEYASQAGAMFRETDTDWTKGFPQCPGLPAEVIPVKSDMVLHIVGGGDTLLSSTTIPQPLVDDLTKYKECFGTSLCALDLEKNGQSCFAGNQSQCLDWRTDPNQGQYTCKYGAPGKAQVVSMNECAGVYSPTFQPEATRTGIKYGNPATGTPADSPSRAPDASTDKGAFNSPVQDPSKPRECFPTGWGIANPLNWVLQPAKCALEWAFVPRAEKLDEAVDGMKDATASSGFGSIARVVSGLTTMATPAAGPCLGPPLTININAWDIHKTSYPLSSCDEPMRGVASTVKLLGSGVILLVSMMACTRYLAGIIGFTAFGLASAGGDPDDATVNLRTGEVK